jgi:hypothetical protein
MWRLLDGCHITFKVAHGTLGEDKCDRAAREQKEKYYGTDQGYHFHFIKHKFILIV